MKILIIILSIDIFFIFIVYSIIYIKENDFFVKDRNLYMYFFLL